MEPDEFIELCESWINGNRKDVAIEVLRMDTDDLVRFMAYFCNKFESDDISSLANLVEDEKEERKKHPANQYFHRPGLY
jgi:hypothetical protein